MPKIVVQQKKMIITQRINPKGFLVYIFHTFSLKDESLIRLLFLQKLIEYDQKGLGKSKGRIINSRQIVDILCHVTVHGKHFLPSRIYWES